MKKLRVLVISHMFPSQLLKQHGIFIYRQAEYLAKYGVECSFIVPRPWFIWPMHYLDRWKKYSDANKLLISEGVEVKTARYFRPPGLWFHRFEGISMAMGVKNTAIRWHKENPFDVVMGVSMLPDTEAAAIVGRELNIPVAGLAVGSDVMVYTKALPVLWKKLGGMLGQIDLIIGVSQMLCDRMKEAGKCKRDAVCIYLGRDTKLFSVAQNRNEIRSKLGVSANDIVGIYVGALAHTKGIGELAVVAEELVKKHPDFKLICVGDGPAMHELMELKVKAGRDRAVILPGLLPPHEVPAYLQAADFMVFPSHSEGMPQSVLEAMNCGLPVVATKVGGIPEAVIDGETGLLIDAKNSEQLKTAMEKMINDSKFRHSAAQNALAYVQEKFDPEVNAKRFAEALRSLAG